MKKNNFYVAIVAVISGLMLTACGGLGKMEKYIEELGASATPNPLEVHGDSIQLSINGRFPEKYFHKKVVVESTPVIVYEGGESISTIFISIIVSCSFKSWSLVVCQINFDG